MHRSLLAMSRARATRAFEPPDNTIPSSLRNCVPRPERSASIFKNSCIYSGSHRSGSFSNTATAIGPQQAICFALVSIQQSFNDSTIILICNGLRKHVPSKVYLTGVIATAFVSERRHKKILYRCPLGVSMLASKSINKPRPESITLQVLRC